jgi:hypothetical protein
MEGSIIGSATAISGVLVRITYRQWAHILENHDYMAGNLDIVLETLSGPDFIAKGWKDELIALRHYFKTNITEKSAAVVYKELSENNDGFVITAFLTSKPQKVLKRGILWQK